MSNQPIYLTLDAYLETFDPGSRPHRNTVYNWIRAGKIKHIRPGGKRGKIFIKVGETQSWEDELGPRLSEKVHNLARLMG